MRQGRKYKQLRILIFVCMNIFSKPWGYDKKFKILQEDLDRSFPSQLHIVRKYFAHFFIFRWAIIICNFHVIEF